jgi:hypothetical protein
LEKRKEGTEPGPLFPGGLPTLLLQKIKAINADREVNTLLVVFTCLTFLDIHAAKKESVHVHQQ